MRVVRAAAAAALLCAGPRRLLQCGSGRRGRGQDRASTGSGEIAATSQDVSFTVDGTKTYGTLEIPAHRSGQHLAAALLLAGSGPTDRDGNQPSSNVTPQTLKLVAGVLAQQGIVTFRFDKYFTGQTGAGAFASDPGAIDLNAYIRQADYAYDYLIARPQVDRQRMLVVGHSEGGFYAMLVANTVSTHPAGLALLEPQDQRILSLVALQLDEQLDSAVKQGQLSASAAQQQAEGINNAIAQFRAGQQVDTTGLLPQIVEQLTPELLTPGNAKVARTDDEVSPVERRGQGGVGHPRPGHRRHRRHEHPGQHDQPARQRADRRRDHRTRAEGAHRRQPPPAPAGHAGQRRRAGPLGGGRDQGLGPALRDRRLRRQDGFSNTATWLRLPAVNGARSQPAQRSRSRKPASLPMRSSSDGHT